ncbi:CRISPR-associated protein, Csd1 family [Syntrophobotulus glycolicus DSM 8271]|uniref:CRISPR-associated protein, Csd1 family n=1 Tax=Syntrophobotulus glycolicus (strain DSM 8271 / FlGlyR) TaxID=645991 RepID=F0T1Y4_SYNGF|nr:type I-C CRISPR-associated protein Cas8c/Csd1 [Syntrophobotulus glycolicus]ADY55248.1 CRISPR-associated protein, Csd1 family [Syntrophobotulus glycolicus DSM 8271]
MSWLQKLYQTAENCQSMIGYGSDENEVPLLPICHTTQKAQIEIVIDQDGNFKRARVIPKEEARTIVPCTETSGGRSGRKPETHPLCDKLQYIAGDFVEYGGEVTSGYAKKPREPYEKYTKILSNWCESPYPNTKAQAILKYIKKLNVIKDLIDFQILFVDDNKKLLKSWEEDEESEKNKPDIFKLLPGKINKKNGEVESWQADAFVRWIVEIPNDPQSAVWTDARLFDSWTKYYSSTKESKTLCLVTGKEVMAADQHPAKIRNDGDKAKLISANDTSGFTFRGRFLSAEQACGVGFEVTQKAHNVLRWLINRQGYRRGDQAIVAWATSGKEIPDLMADSLSMLELADMENDSEPVISTVQDLALKLSKKIAGYSVELGSTANVVVLGLESATPGRMAMTFYRELTGSDFLDRLEKWHKMCCWIHGYRSKEIIDSRTGKKRTLHYRFVGAPAPNDIAEAAYGMRVDDRLRKATVERIIPCIIDGRKLPRDLMESAVRRASNRISLEDWDWNKTLSIACALYKKYHEKEDFDMALDEKRNTRDYLYGRLLALADNIEEWAINDSGEKRQTNAARLMQRFADRPYSTWRNLELALGPYKARLGGKSAGRQKLISEVIDMFKPDDFISDKKLSGEFLLGYHSQREALRKKRDEEKQND